MRNFLLYFALLVMFSCNEDDVKPSGTSAIAFVSDPSPVNASTLPNKSLSISIDGSLWGIDTSKTYYGGANVPTVAAEDFDKTLANVLFIRLTEPNGGLWASIEIYNKLGQYAGSAKVTNARKDKDTDGNIYYGGDIEVTVNSMPDKDRPSILLKGSFYQKFENTPQ